MLTQKIKIIEIVNKTLVVEERVVDTDGVVQLDGKGTPMTTHIWAPLTEVKFKGKGLAENGGGVISIESLPYKIKLALYQEVFEPTQGFNTPPISFFLLGNQYTKIEEIYPLLKEL